MPFTQTERQAISRLRRKGLADVEARYGPDAIIESINVTEDDDGTVHIIAHVSAAISAPSGRVVGYREDIEL